MLSRALLLITVSAFAGCAPMSSADEDAVGTWQEDSADAVMRYSFTADHKVALCFSQDGSCEPAEVVHGTWWIRGDDVVYSLNLSPFAQKRDRSL